MTLLTGDVKLSKEDAHLVANYLRGNDVLLQVPHHGSFPNWESFSTLQGYFYPCVIPFGFGNTYEHPSNKTIADLAGRVNKLIVISTQFHRVTYFYQQCCKNDLVCSECCSEDIEDIEDEF